MSTSTDVVVVTEDPFRTEAIAVVGFLAGYGAATRRSYGTDLRQFSSWCHQADLTSQEELVDRNPALNVRRPKVDYE